MEIDQERLKLGKSSAFVKTHLRRLPPCDEIWEVDFMWALSSANLNETVWHGLVVAPDGGILAQRTLERSPTVNDMADLLADAMRRPSDEAPRRPHSLRIRERQEWRELLPHLQQLVERVVSAPRLARWDKAFKEFSRRNAKFDTPSPPLRIDRLFPVIAQWVRTIGRIEIGDQEGSGFIVRALDCGGLVFEHKEAKTLAEALSALETGLADQFES